MNSHERLQSELIDLVHRELSPWRALQVRLHLAHCADCRLEKKRLETLWISLRALHAPSTTPTRLRLKGKPMQVRVALAAFSAVFCAVGGTVINRALHKPQAYACSSYLQSLHAQVLASGAVRGKLIFNVPGKTSTQLSDNSLTLAGGGTSDTTDVTIRPENDQSSKILAHFSIKLGESREVRDPKGKLIAIARLVPLIPDEDKHLREEDRQVRQRLVDLYQNPATISLDRPHLVFSSIIQMPGLIAWSADNRDAKGRFIIGPNGLTGGLETKGLAWKLIGYARVKMTLLTDPQHPNYVRDIEALNRSVSVKNIVDVASAVGDLFPEPTTVPRIYWSQSVPFNEGQQGVCRQGKYWLDEKGGWKNVARSGEFTGYGKHVVNGPDGKPQLILEVSPL